MVDIKSKKMEQELKKAKIELVTVGDSILSKIGPVSSANTLEGLANRMTRLQSFITIFPEKATDLSNDLLKKHVLEFGEKSANEFREKLIKLTKAVVFDFRDKILEG